MSNIRAKFRVTGKDHQHIGGPDDVCCVVSMAPVFGDDSEENKSFSKYTPQGEIKMTITNPDAIDKFDLGASYYVDFTLAD